jgi:hypothetical protein
MIKLQAKAEAKAQREQVNIGQPNMGNIRILGTK